MKIIEEWNGREWIKSELPIGQYVIRVREIKEISNLIDFELKPLIKKEKIKNE